MGLSIPLKNWRLKLTTFLEKERIMPVWKIWLILGLGIVTALTLFALFAVYVFDPWVLKTSN